MGGSGEPLIDASIDHHMLYEKCVSKVVGVAKKILYEEIVVSLNGKVVQGNVLAKV